MNAGCYNVERRHCTVCDAWKCSYLEKQKPWRSGPRFFSSLSKNVLLPRLSTHVRAGFGLAMPPCLAQATVVKIWVVDFVLDASGFPSRRVLWACSRSDLSALHSRHLQRSSAFTQEFLHLLPLFGFHCDPQQLLSQGRGTRVQQKRAHAGDICCDSTFQTQPLRKTKALLQIQGSCWVRAHLVSFCSNALRFT